ncbi:hypothetical protein ACFL4H_00325 [Candidatus Neomarinimicrobiota bacterium]
MAVTAKQAVKRLRSENPKRYQFYSDADLLRQIVKEDSSIINYISDWGDDVYSGLGGTKKRDPFQSVGYDPKAVDHLKATAYNATQMGLGGFESLITMAAGITGSDWFMDRAEDTRAWSKEKLGDWMASDIKMQAYMKWQEDEPFEIGNIFKLDMMARALTHLAPSMALMLIPGGAAVTSLKGLKAGANLMKYGPKMVQFLSMATLEASEVGQMAVESLQEQGMTRKEAYQTGTKVMALHGAFAGMIEYMQLNHALGFLKLRRLGDKQLSRYLARIVLRATKLQNTVVRKPLDLLTTAITETLIQGGQEYFQGMSSAVAQGAIERYGGDLSLAAKMFPSELQEYATSEEAVQGMWTGISGFLPIGGANVALSTVQNEGHRAAEQIKFEQKKVAKQLQYGNITEEEANKQVQEVYDKEMKRALSGLSGKARDKAKKGIDDYIWGSGIIVTASDKDEQAGIGVYDRSVKKAGERPMDEVASYIQAATNPEEMKSFVDKKFSTNELEEGASDVEEQMYNDRKIGDSAVKLLNLIALDAAFIDEIAKNQDALNLVADKLLTSQKDKRDVANMTQEDKVKLLNIFKFGGGKVIEEMPTVGGLEGGGQLSGGFNIITGDEDKMDENLKGDLGSGGGSGGGEMNLTGQGSFSSGSQGIQDSEKASEDFETKINKMDQAGDLRTEAKRLEVETPKDLRSKQAKERLKKKIIAAHKKPAGELTKIEKQINVLASKAELSEQKYKDLQTRKKELQVLSRTKPEQAIKEANIVLESLRKRAKERTTPEGMLTGKATRVVRKAVQGLENVLRNKGMKDEFMSLQDIIPVLQSVEKGETPAEDVADQVVDAIKGISTEDPAVKKQVEAVEKAIGVRKDVAKEKVPKDQRVRFGDITSKKLGSEIPLEKTGTFVSKGISMVEGEDPHVLVNGKRQDLSVEDMDRLRNALEDKKSKSKVVRQYAIDEIEDVVGEYIEETPAKEKPNVNVPGITKVDRYSPAIVKGNPDKVFIFGDNLQKKGKGGQAVIRDEPNAFGIPTKKKPSSGTDAYFNDKQFQANKTAIDEAFENIPKDKEIVLPADGLGTGLAQLDKRAPKTFAYIEEKIQELIDEKTPVVEKENAPTEGGPTQTEVSDEEMPFPEEGGEMALEGGEGSFSIGNVPSQLEAKFDNEEKGEGSFDIPDTDRKKTVHHQKRGSSFPLINPTKTPGDDNITKTAKGLAARLNNHFAGHKIKAETFVGLIREHGKEYIGVAVGRLVRWSETDGRLDTMPHEYAHVYIELMADTPVVKLAIQQLMNTGLSESEANEKLATHIGEYYATRYQEQSNFLKDIGRWLKQYINRLKNRFNLLNKGSEDLMNFISEEMYQGRFIGGQYAQTRGTKKYQKNKIGAEPAEANYIAEEPLEWDSEESGPPETSTVMAGDTLITKYFNSVYGVYLPPPILGRLIGIAKAAESFAEYEKVATKVVKDYSKRAKYKEIKTDFMERKTEDQMRRYNLLNYQYLQDKYKIERHQPDNEEQNGSGRLTRVYWTALRGVDRIRGRGDKYFDNGIRKFEIGFVHMGAWETREIEVGEDGSLISYKGNRKQGKYDAETFVESRAEASGNYDFLPQYLRIKDTIDLVHHKKGDGVDRYGVDSTSPLKVSELVQFENETMEDAAISLTKGEEGKATYVIAMKPGDKSAVFFGQVPPSVMAMSMQELENAFAEEIKKGNLTAERVNELYKDLDYVTLDRATKVAGSFKEWMLENVAEGETAGNAMKRYRKVLYTNMGRVILAQRYSWLRSMQMLKGDDFLLHEKSIGNTISRLSIPFTEGQSPVGIGKQSAWIVPLDAKVSAVFNGKRMDMGLYEDFDGGTFSGHSWFGGTGKVLGKAINTLKTVFNHNSGKDLLGVKHQQFSPYKAMKIVYGNTTLRYISGGRWQNIETGEIFDHIFSPNEAKEFSGRFRDGKEIQYGLHEFEETDIKIIKTPKHSKTVASPLAGIEALLTTKGVAKDIIKMFTSHYSNVAYNNEGTGYMDAIYRFKEDPEYFMNAMRRDIEAGRIVPEAQQYLDILKRTNGQGIHFPQVSSYFAGYINNHFIKDGVLTGRNPQKGVGSQVTLKPIGDKILKKGEAWASLDNRTIVRQIIKKYKKAGGKTTWVGMVGEAREGEMLSRLNEFLQDNEVDVLIHRQPISEATGLMVRRITNLLEHGHDETFMLSKADVKELLNGDWDADTVLVEFLSEDMLNGFKKLQDSPQFKKLMKTIHVESFGNKVENQDDAAFSSNRSELFNQMANQIQTSGSIGFMQNVKQALHSLSYKKLRFKTEGSKDGEWIVPYDPNEEVVMDYMPLDNENILKDYSPGRSVFKMHLEQGDTILDGKGNRVTEQQVKDENDVYYLKTTKRNELSIIQQMAFDDPKFLMLQKLPNRYEQFATDVPPSAITKNAFTAWVTTLMFKKVDDDNIDVLDDNGNSIQFTFNELRALRGIRASASYSEMRHGKSNGKLLGLEGNITQSKALFSRYYDEQGTLLPNSTIRKHLKGEAEWAVRSNRGHKITDFEVNNNISVGERLIMGIYEGWRWGIKNGKRYERDWSKYEGRNPLLLKKEYTIDAHLRTIKAMTDHFMKLKNVPKHRTSMMDGWRFMHQPVENNMSFLEEFRLIGKIKAEASRQDTENYYPYLDFQEEYIRLVERHLPRWQALEPVGKEYATFNFLSDAIENNQLTPLDITNFNALATYLKGFGLSLAKTNKAGLWNVAEALKHNNEMYALHTEIEKTVHEQMEEKGNECNG